MCYTATDVGEEHQLERYCQAEKEVHLKVNAPVVLLMNLSRKLVNGSRGTVTAVEEDGPIIHFHSSNIIMKMVPRRFSVYSVQDKCEVASREQIPIKLAYAFTVHKSQGMTFSKLDIDARCMWHPGQLGVAMGRATSIKTVRVRNVSHANATPHPPEVQEFYRIPSNDSHDDLGCCKKEAAPIDVGTRDALANEGSLWSDSDADDILVHTLGVFQEETLQHDNEAASTSTQTSSEGVPSTSVESSKVPEGFAVLEILEQMKFESEETPSHCESNAVIRYLLGHMGRLEDFVSKAWSKVSETMAGLKAGLPTGNKIVSVAYGQLMLFMQSHEYQEILIELFSETDRRDPSAAECNICFKVVTALREFFVRQTAIPLITHSEKKMKRRCTATQALG